MGQCAALCAGMALVACGGSGDPPAAGTPRLAAGTVAAASGGGRAATALPSSYILTRIGEGWIQDGRSLNDSGQVAGSYYPPGSERPHAFLFDGMTQRDLGTLGNGAGASLASGINAAGQVTGFATRGETIRAFLYDGAAMKDLGTLSGPDQRTWSNGLAINDAGMVTGYAFNGVTNHAFVSDGSVMTDLGTLGNADSWSHGNDINASGQVTGDAEGVAKRTTEGPTCTADGARLATSFVK